jgi:hypothetical protein
MKLERESSSWLSKQSILVAYAVLTVAIVGTVLLVSTTRVFETSRVGEIPQIIWLMISLILLFGVIFVLSKTLKVLSEIEDTNIKLERIADLLHRNNESLGQIMQSVQPNRPAAVTTPSSQEQPVAGETAQNDSAVDETGDEEPAEALAEQKELSSVDSEQIMKVTAEVETLFQEYRWAEASKEIESLIAAYPNSQEARALQQQLAERKQSRKKVLLASWEAAVKRGATDRSIEILKELDPYLLPNEGLALQEAAKDVYKNKLHNLGVQFSLAVSGSHWRKAFEVGQEIISHYPNSRMAEEIRDKIDVLEQKSETQAG